MNPGKSLFKRGLVTVLGTILLLSSTAAHAQPTAELVLAIGGEPDQGYDPIFGWGQYGHPLFQSTLLRRNIDLSIAPDLATDLTLSDDGRVWTVTLRDDVRFSDETPLTAADVAFTFNTAAGAGGTMDMSVFSGARALDDRRVEITLQRPWITFVEFFFTLGIVPAAGYQEGYGRAPVGSGPFRMVSWVPGEQLIAERNPYYYGESGQFDRLVFVFTDEDTSLAAANAGRVNILSVPAPLADAVPPGFKRVVAQSVDNRGMSFPMLPAGGTSASGLAIGNDVTADPAIRRAINMGIDRETLVDVALFGHGTPAWGPADGLPWSNPDAALSYDPEAARSLLDRAGWSPQGDGIRSKGSLRASFPLNFPSSDSTRQALAMTVAGLLRDIGIEVIAKGVAWDEIGRIAHSQPVLFGWGSHSPLEVYSLYQSGRAGEGYQNVGYFENAAVDAHFAAAQSAGSLEDSYPLWRAAEWDGETGYGARGAAAWAWLVNLDHVYFVDECLDTGAMQIEPHGHGWPITTGIENWRWTCQ